MKRRYSLVSNTHHFSHISAQNKSVAKPDVSRIGKKNPVIIEGQ